MITTPVLSKESVALLAAAQYLEDAAYALAGNADVSTVTRLMLLSKEVCDIEDRVVTGSRTHQ